MRSAKRTRGGVFTVGCEGQCGGKIGWSWKSVKRGGGRLGTAKKRKRKTRSKG